MNYINYRFFRKNNKEEIIGPSSKTVYCCVYKNSLFTICHSCGLSDKSVLYVSNLDGTGEKKLLTEDYYTAGLFVRATIENDVIYLHYHRIGHKDDIWKREWYDLKTNHEWETLNDDSVGIFSI